MSLYLPEGFLIKTEENKKALGNFENFKEAFKNDLKEFLNDLKLNVKNTILL